MIGLSLGLGFPPGNPPAVEPENPDPEPTRGWSFKAGRLYYEGNPLQYVGWSDGSLAALGNVAFGEDFAGEIDGLVPSVLMCDDTENEDNIAYFSFWIQGDVVAELTGKWVYLDGTPLITMIHPPEVAQVGKANLSYNETYDMTAIEGYTDAYPSYVEGETYNVYLGELEE